MTARDFNNCQVFKKERVNKLSIFAKVKKYCLFVKFLQAFCFCFRGAPVLLVLQHYFCYCQVAFLLDNNGDNMLYYDIYFWLWLTHI